MIKSKLLSKYTEIAHFCTSREGGVSLGNYASNNLSPYSGDNAADFSQNQQILCTHLGITPGQLIMPYQTHGTEVRQITDVFRTLQPVERIAYLQGVDALVTDITGICIGVTTADCIPLLFFDPQQKVIAVAHAGWRGTCNRIATKTIQVLTERHNCQSENIEVFIGPSISPNVYEVGQEVVGQFEHAGFDTGKIIRTKNGSIFLDLWKANVLQLEESGVLPDQIEISGICTYTRHEEFFSARRLGITSGRMLSGIMLRQ